MSKANSTIIQAPPLMVDRHHAAAALGVSDGTVESLVRSGDLPPPRRISPGRTGWLWRELQEFAETRPVSNALPGPGRRAAASAP
ncbi:AlpA family transcriptional regulator [Pelomonas sp. Root1444]|uniref:helix-turn-helix transcriptional regulator n=1 Tax=Pelomonas sp. Root1444 TaxID=1736464 RepID=UPI000AD3A79F|nr:helix-turn-helix domain-containing protein [Pelomonas sp. Root1444]